MSSPRVSLLCAALVAVASASAAESSTLPSARPAIETGPAIGWVFPLFTDAEGYHLLTLRVSSARIVGEDRIDVTDFHAIAFSGDATERVDSVLLSPKAVFYPKKNVATGDSSVRLIHDDIEVTGVGWRYDNAAKKVSLAHDVRVTFHSQLNDLLK